MGKDREEINMFDLFKMESSDNNEGKMLIDDDIPEIEDVTVLDKDNDNQEELEEDDSIEERETEEEEEITADTEDETEEDADTDPETDLFTTFASSLIENDILIALEDKEYDSSEEGIREMVEDTIKVKNQEFIKSQHQVVQDLISFIANGGDPDEFVSNVTKSSYKDIDIDDEDNQKLLIREHLELQDIDEDEIDELIEEYEESGSLSKHSKIAHKVLLKKQEDEYNNLLKQQEVASKEREKELVKREEEFKDTIFKLKDKELAGLKLTEKDTKEFYDYLTKPVKKDRGGRLLTQYQVDSETEDKRLEQAFYQFKGGVKAIEKNVDKKKTMSIKKKLSHYQDSMASKSSTSNNNTSTSSGQTNKNKVKLPYAWA